MIRISPYPRLGGSNAYLDLYYRALEPYGFTLAKPLEYNNRFLVREAPNFDVIHLQWSHEDLWRFAGRHPLAAVRGVGSLWRFMRLARRLGKPVVWTAHDLVPHDGMSLGDRLGTTLLARSVDLLLCHSEATRHRLIRDYGARPDAVVVIAHGNYDGVFPPPRPAAETLQLLGLRPGRRTLVAAGALRAYKGLDIAIGAMAELSPDYQLIVAGGYHAHEQSLVDHLRHLAERAGNVVMLAGDVDNQQFADLYGAADCVLLPYRQITGSGALLTSWTLGRAVVASDLPFFREQLTDESAGILVAVEDPKALARGVRQFFEGDVAARHRAARKLADLVPWPDVVRPAAIRIRALVEGGMPPTPHDS